MLEHIVLLLTVWVIPVIVAVTFHEAAHGYVAHLLGDDTAWRLGRVTFNPLKHIDPVGTILMPGILLLLQRRSCSATPSRCRSGSACCATRGATPYWSPAPDRR